MRKLLFLLGLLFMGVGYTLISAIQEPSKEDLPKMYEKTGVVSLIDIYKTSKFGEVCYIELEGVETRFWLKARLEKKEGVKKQLLADLKVGDKVTAYYRSVEGTQFAYASAPYNVHHLVKSDKTIDGLAFVTKTENSPFLVTIFYGLGSIISLVGILLFGFFLWSFRPKQ